MPSIDFRGQKVEYDLSALKSWTVQRTLAQGEIGAKWFDVIDRILCGKADDVLAEVGDDIDEDLGPLLAEVGADAAKRSKTAKN